MRSQLLRAATTLSVLAAGLPWATIAPTAIAAPNPSLRVKVVQAEGGQSAGPTLPAAESPTTEIDNQNTVQGPETQASNAASISSQESHVFSGTPKVYPVESQAPPSKSWELRPGIFLRAALQEWANEAGWSLVWAMPERDDFRIDSGNRFTGDFKDAVVGLFDALPQHIQIFAELRPDNSPPLIYVTREQGVR